MSLSRPKAAQETKPKMLQQRATRKGLTSSFSPEVSTLPQMRRYPSCTQRLPAAATANGVFSNAHAFIITIYFSSAKWIETSASITRIAEKKAFHGWERQANPVAMNMSTEKDIRTT